jgi:penicillin G amidase
MDRLWQLEFFRRLASGRLSEVFGSETLALDKFSRTVGINRMADKYL